MYRVCKSGLTNDIAPSIHGASYMMWEDEALYPQHTGPSHIGEEAECPPLYTGLLIYNSGIDIALWVY